jgi:hypothetical protein
MVIKTSVDDMNGGGDWEIEAEFHLGLLGDPNLVTLSTGDKGEDDITFNLEELKIIVDSLIKFRDNEKKYECQ